MSKPEPSGVRLKALELIRQSREIQPFVALPERRRALEKAAAELEVELRGQGGES